MADGKASNSGNGNGGVKAVGMIVTILAALGGVYMMVDRVEVHFSQRMDFIERLLHKLETNMDEDDKIETANMGRFSALQEKFAEVETQFRALSALVDKAQERDQARLSKLEIGQREFENRERGHIGCDAAREQRIINLEKKTGVCK